MQHSDRALTNKTMRPPAIAGRFYPAESAELAKLVDNLLVTAGWCESSAPGSFPKALIVPHAGYQYSGEVAASAYAQLSNARAKVSRVILLGPAHRVHFTGLAASSADYFASPLGRIPLDVATARQCVKRYPFVSFNNKAHQHEHSLETQLPFLQRCLGNFSLLPMVIGNADPEQVSQCLAHLWGGEETLVVISSDLSHFLPYSEAQEKDAFTSRAICNLDPTPISSQHACGQLGVRGMLHVARLKKLSVRQLDLRNSGDTAARKDKVVGYGSYGFYNATSRFNRAQRSALTDAAWSSIDHGLATGKLFTPSLAGCEDSFARAGASFVTLNDSAGKLRGCIGTLSSKSPLLVNICHNAYKAAFSDQRFNPLTVDERRDLHLEVSVLNPPRRIHGNSEEEIISQINPFVDGVIFVDQGKRGTFLPSVWKTISTPAAFFLALKQKGGFQPDYWSESVEVFRYSTETW